MSLLAVLRFRWSQCPGDCCQVQPRHVSEAGQAGPLQLHRHWESRLQAVGVDHQPTQGSNHRPPVFHTGHRGSVVVRESFLLQQIRSV